MAENDVALSAGSHLQNKVKSSQNGAGGGLLPWLLACKEPATCLFLLSFPVMSAVLYNL